MASKSELFREEITKRAIANREVRPVVATLSDAELRADMEQAGRDVVQANIADTQEHTDSTLKALRAAIEIYFGFRYEYDYRQIQGC